MKSPSIPNSPMHKAHKHESAFRHTSGAAQYVDDIRADLITHVVLSEVARATNLVIDTSKASSMEGVHAIITAADIPGDPLVGPIMHDEPILADGEILYHGQAIALVIAESYESARHAARQLDVQYEKHTPILSIQDAIDANSFHNRPHRIARGDLLSVQNQT